MAITSANKTELKIQLRSSQLRYALIYVAITLAVLIFLNIYSSKQSYALFYSEKEISMMEKCQLAANKLESLGVLNNQTVSSALSELELETVSHIVVTDNHGMLIYDSHLEAANSNSYILYPEIIAALKGEDIFTWRFYNKQMQSKTAIPVFSFGRITGCVYMMESDIQQGMLIASLQSNILTITIALEIIVIAFSILFSTMYSGRLKKIMTLIHRVRAGDYAHKIEMSGNDELRILSDEFNDLTKKLQRSESRRRQFVSDASHELKTPLASIKLLSDSILQNKMNEETVKEFVNDIGNEADRLNRMSQKLLNLAKTEDQPEVDCEITYTYPTIEKVCRMLGSMAQKQQVTIHTQTKRDATILIQEDDLYQIIFNLVENGIKYNRVDGKLNIIIDSNDENLFITIRDTGVGIPEDSIEQIFERFYRVDKARSRSTGGSGLGLSIVKSMVERNKGTIHVESTLGSGTAFFLSFPVFDMGGAEKND